MSKIVYKIMSKIAMTQVWHTTGDKIHLVFVQLIKGRV